MMYTKEEAAAAEKRILEGIPSQIRLREKAEKAYLAVMDPGFAHLPKDERTRLLIRLSEADEAVAEGTRSLIYALEDECGYECDVSPSEFFAEPLYAGHGAHIVCGPLVPKERAGSHAAADWFGSMLRRPLNRFFAENPVDLNDSYIYHIVSVYTDLSARRIRDFDNIELKALIDVVGRSSHLGDSPKKCGVHLSISGGDSDRTEIFIIREESFGEYIGRFLERTRHGYPETE